MASSDDEETIPKYVSDYEFISKEDDPISFDELPVKWIKGGTVDKKLQQMFLRGTTDNGNHKLYKEVIAWKFDLSCQKPEMSVLSVEGHWIKLQKPRKAFEVIIRTILITVQFLHLVKWNPQISHKALWDQLTKTFSVFDTRPSENDLVDHMSLIREAVKRDETLVKSKVLSTFLEEKPRKRTVFVEDTKPSFIVDEVTENEDQKSDQADESDDDSEADDCFDSVCAICDNGGNIYICEGKCMRSFHATEEDGEESNCESLGFTEEELEAMKNVDFLCKNCEYKKHQCFCCGELGSSDESSGPEVFRCLSGACGRFYHPGCVAKLLHPKDNAEAENLCREISAGEQFTCPVHKCRVCKEVEVRSDHELQFAICRRCPRAYHRKCLPRSIAFEEDVDEGRAKIQRAWENLIPNRILIYCMKHEIDESIFTPVRDHIKFPGPKKLKRNRSVALDDTSGKRSSVKPSKAVEKVYSNSKLGVISRKRADKLHAQGFSTKQKLAVSRNSLGHSNKSAVAEDKISLGERLYAAYGLNSEPVRPSHWGKVRGELEKTQNVMATSKKIDHKLALNADSKERMLALIKNSSSSVTLEDIKKRHKTPSTHTSRFVMENVTLGKVEGSVRALRAALEKLDKGGSVQDAKAVCGNDLLDQMKKWKEKLKVYLAPFLYGMRYTSFGRHFTNVDKLKGIVDLLQWYIQDGDMVVDFCCGSNDFSCIMKSKLDDLGKSCSFKNYDILQAKNDFCFERRDWMGVKRNELPEGSRLIMGLNPPFGVNAALANKFINKALEFKPKLLILIVPRETQRLDEKKSPYDLIWEDDQLLAGKSFYLPGSIDVNDKQIEDWNVTPPGVYLWSSPDWTAKHKAIAEQHGHPTANFKLEEPPQLMPQQALSESREGHHNLDEVLNQVDDKKLSDEQGNLRKRKETPPLDNAVDHECGINMVKKKKIGSIEENSAGKMVIKEKSPGKKVVEDKSAGKMVIKEKFPDKKVVEDKAPNEKVVDEKSLKRKIVEEKLSNKKIVEDTLPDKKVWEDKSYRNRSLSRNPSPNVSEFSSPSDVYTAKHVEKQSHGMHATVGDDMYLARRNREVSPHPMRERNNQQFVDRVPYHPYPQRKDDENQVDELVKQYSLRGGESFQSMTGIYAPSPPTQPDYRYTGSYSEERPSYNRSSFSGALDPITPQSHPNFHGREVNPWNNHQRNDYMSGYPAGPNGYGLQHHGQLNPPPDNSSYGGISTSAMQRYASRLDDVNHGPAPLHPGPGEYSGGGSQVGGFAPGPYRPPYTLHNSSSGWLNE